MQGWPGQNCWALAAQAQPELGQLSEQVSVGGYRNGKSLQSVLRASEEVVHISYHAAAQETAPTQLLQQLTQHSIFFWWREMAPFPLLFMVLIDFFLRKAVCYLQVYNKHHPDLPTLGPAQGTLQKTPTDLCGTENPILSPLLHHPQISPVLSRVQKWHLAKPSSCLERPVGNIPTLIHHRVPGQRLWELRGWVTGQLGQDLLWKGAWESSSGRQKVVHYKLNTRFFLLQVCGLRNVATQLRRTLPCPPLQWPQCCLGRGKGGKYLAAT